MASAGDREAHLADLGTHARQDLVVEPAHGVHVGVAVHGAHEEQLGSGPPDAWDARLVEAEGERQHAHRQRGVARQQGTTIVFGQREDAIELPADAGLEPADGPPVQPGPRSRSGAACQMQPVQRRSGELVDGDRELGHRQGAVNGETGLQILDVEKVEAAPAEETVGGAAQPSVGGGDACGRPRTGRPAELLQVQAGQLRAEPPSVLLLARLHPAQHGDPVTLGRPGDPLGQRTSTRVAGVDFRQEGTDPENVHA